MDMNAQLYRDMSWGKMDWESTYAPQVYDMTGEAVGFKAGEMSKQAIAAAESDGYIFCWGTCGTSKANEEHRTGSTSGKFDQFVVAFRGGPPDYAWAGLATLSHPFTWTKYPTSTGIIMHEVHSHFVLTLFESNGFVTGFCDYAQPR